MTRVRPGEPLEIEAQTWNDARDFFGSRRHGLSEGLADVAQHAFPIRIKNNSGADRTRGELLRLEHPGIDPEDSATPAARTPLILGNESRFGDDGGVAILLEPIKDGKIGWVALSGYCLAKVDILDVEHQYAAIDYANPERLVSAWSGCVRIIPAPETPSDPKLGLRLVMATVLPVAAPRWAKIPLSGVPAALGEDEASVTECDWYAIDPRDNKLKDTERTYKVHHFGAEILAAGVHLYPYMQTMPFPGGQVVNVEYCDG